MRYKRFIMILLACLGLIISSLSIYVGFEFLVEHNKWIGLIIGVSFMMVSIIVYQFGEKHQWVYLVSFILNMIGVGLSITAYYVLKVYSLSLKDFMVAIGVSMSLLIGFALFSKIKFVKEHHKLFLAMIIAFSFIASLILWLDSDQFTGLSFYFLNIIYFFMIGIVQLNASFSELTKEVAWISFGAFILISIIVLIILSEGEALTGMDGISPTGSSKRKKKIKTTLQ